MRKQAAIRQADVLDVLKDQDKPMTAYAILDQMKRDEPDLAAPIVYRAIAALTDQTRGDGCNRRGTSARLSSCRAVYRSAVDRKRLRPVASYRNPTLRGVWVLLGVVAAGAIVSMIAALRANRMSLADGLMVRA